MNLKSKKRLAAKVTGVGAGRIWLNPERLEEIKESLTKQDIRDLLKEGMIRIKPITGGRKVKIRKTRRRTGSVSKRVSSAKRDYVNRIRSIRLFLKNLKKAGSITSKDYSSLNRKAKSSYLKSINEVRNYVSEKMKKNIKPSEGKENK